MNDPFSKRPQKAPTVGELVEVGIVMLDFIRFTLVAPMVGNECSQTLYRGLLKLDPETLRNKCFSLLVSKYLGLGIVVGSSIVKVPQIVKIAASGSTKGVSILAYLLETVSLVITLSYNIRMRNPFSTFGELAFISVQNAIILAMLLIYAKRYSSLLLAIVLFGAFSFVLNTSHIVSQELLVSLQWGSIIIATASKFPQIFSNLMNGNTGQLSEITVGLQFIGAAARIFTTLREVDDVVILTSFLVATALNGILFLQVLMTGGEKGKSTTKGGKKGKGKKQVKSE